MIRSVFGSRRSEVKQVTCLNSIISLNTRDPCVPLRPVTSMSSVLSLMYQSDSTGQSIQVHFSSLLGLGGMNLMNTDKTGGS